MIANLAMLLLAAAEPAAVTGISIMPVADRTEVLIEVDGPVTIDDFSLGDPDRLVIDIAGAQHALPADRFNGIRRGGVLAVRSSQYRANVVRVVLELSEPVSYTVRQEGSSVRVIFKNPGGSFDAWRSIGAGAAVETAPVEVRPVQATRPTTARVQEPVVAQQFPEEPRITVSFEAAPMLDVIATFAAFSGRSIVAGPNVTGNVTADINNQPWDLALEAILESHGYTISERDSGILQVIPLADLRERETIEDLVTRNFRIRYTSVDSIVPAIQGLLTERGRVTRASATNTLIVTDGRSVLQRIEPLIEQLDVRTPQVTIAAKLVFIDRTTLEELGVVYDLKDSRGSQFNSVVSGFRDIDGDGVLEPNEATDEDVILLGGSSIAALANAQSRVASPTLRLVTTLLLGRHSLITFIDALESLQLSDIQAAPVVTVLDHRQARIQVGEETPVRTIDAGAGGGTGGAFPQATVTFRETGVILQVTPHVTGDQVLLELHAERSNLAAAPSDLGITFQTQESDTQVLVNDGETVVIGGLTIIEKTQARSGIPFLMDLPVIGRLFSTTTDRENKRDLMIMVTPHIVRDGV
ncbi:MAG: AMIN domain-containing protein [Longimicrobiales bacterium]